MKRAIAWNVVLSMIICLMGLMVVVAPAEEENEEVISWAQLSETCLSPSTA